MDTHRTKNTEYVAGTSTTTTTTTTITTTIATATMDTSTESNNVASGVVDSTNNKIANPTARITGLQNEYEYDYVHECEYYQCEC